VLAVIWGGSIPLTKLGLRDFPPLTLTALRYVIAAPFFAASGRRSAFRVRLPIRKPPGLIPGGKQEV
jgi:drug/metabolite transporter (DMT)-like permease